MKFEIIDKNYKVSSRGLNKSEVLYAFVQKGAGKVGCFIRDSEGLDMKFNEFFAFYYNE